MPCAACDSLSSGVNRFFSFVSVSGKKQGSPLSAMQFTRLLISLQYLRMHKNASTVRSRN